MLMFCHKSVCTWLKPFYSLTEHRPLTTPFHRTWFSAHHLVSCFHLHPAFVISASISLRHVFLHLPLFLLPRGLLVSGCLVIYCFGFLRVWLIYFRFLVLIECSISSWCILSHSASLLTVFGHHVLSYPKTLVSSTLVLLLHGLRCTSFL